MARIEKKHRGDRKYGVKPYDLDALGIDENAFREKFMTLLRRERFNITKVAKVLEVSRPTIYRRMTLLGIKPPRIRRANSIFTKDDALTAAVVR